MSSDVIESILTLMTYVFFVPVFTMLLLDEDYPRAFGITHLGTAFLIMLFCFGALFAKILSI